jgi:hypothetical protein
VIERAKILVMKLFKFVRVVRLMLNLLNVNSFVFVCLNVLLSVRH